MQNANSLKVNDDFSSKQPQLIQAINVKNTNSLSIKNFVSWSPKKAKIMSKRYYGVELVVGVESYIQFYHRIPANLPAELWRKEWLTSSGELRDYARFRYKQGLNRKKKHNSPEAILESVRDALADGFNPFDKIMEGVKDHDEAQAVVAPLHVAKSAGPSFMEAVINSWSSIPNLSHPALLKKILRGRRTM